MAFPKEEDRKKINKRTLEILAQSPELGNSQAALQAINELFTPERIQQEFAPSFTPETPETKLEKARGEYESVEAEALAVRTKELQNLGLSFSEALSRAQSELGYYRQPAPLGFGTIEERLSETKLDPGLGILPAPKFDVTQEGEIPGAVEAPSEQLPPTTSGEGIAWDKVSDLFQKNFNYTREEAQADVEALRTTFYDPALAQAKKDGLAGKEAVDQAIKVASDEYLETIRKLTNKDTYVKDRPTEGGPADIWFEMFARQEDLGEGVPDLSPKQIDFLNRQQNYLIEEEVKRRLQDPKKKTIMRLPDGRTVPYPEGGFRGAVSGLPKGTKVENVELTEDEIRAQVRKENPQPWWLSPIREEVIKDPEKYTDFAIIQSESPLGKTKETTGGQLLRGAMAPWNAIAGVASEAVFGGLGPTGERDFGEAIYANVKENRGYMGEFQKAAEEAKVKQVGKGDSIFPEGTGEVLYYTTLGGGFAADLLDPSIDIAKAGAVGAKTGLQTARGLDKILVGAKARPAFSAAGSAFADDLLDTTLFDLMNRGRKKITPKRIEDKIPSIEGAGDFRSVVSREVASELDAYKQAREIFYEEDLPAFRASSAANTRFGQKFIAEIDSGKPLQEALQEAQKIAKQPDALFKKVDGVLDDLDQVAEGTKDAFSVVRRKELGRALGAVAKVDEEIETILRNVDANPTGGPKLNQYLRALLEEDKLGKVKKALIYDLASLETSRATKGMTGYDNLVALTRNTFASKRSGQEILRSVKESQLGKLGDEFGPVVPKVIRRTEVVSPRFVGARPQDLPTTIASSPEIVPAFTLKEGQASVLDSTIDEMVTYNKLDPQVADLMKRRIAEGFITTEDYRLLLETAIDLKAEGLAITGGKFITRGRDIVRGEPKDVVEVLQPLERRHLGEQVFKRLREKFTKPANKQPNLSVGQRTLLDEALTRTSNLDQKLRDDIQRIMRDPEFSKLYGVEDPASLTPQEALSYLIVGPRGPETASVAGAGAAELAGREAARQDSLIQGRLLGLEQRNEAIKLRRFSELEAQTKRAQEAGRIRGERIEARKGREIDNIKAKATAEIVQARQIGDPDLAKTTEDAIRRKAQQDFDKVRRKYRAEEVAETRRLNKELSDIEAKKEQFIIERDEIYNKGIDRINNSVAGEKARMRAIELDEAQVPVDEKRIEQMLRDVISTIFYNKSAQEDVFDLFTGTSISRNRGVFSPSTDVSFGFDEAAERILQNPKELFPVIQELTEVGKRIIRQGDPSELRYSKENIVDASQKFKGKKIPPEVQVGAYYAAESRRNAERLLGELVTSEIGKANLIATDVLDPTYKQFVYDQFAKIDPDSESPYSILNNVALIKNRLKHRLQPTKADYDVEDVVEIFGSQFAETKANIARLYDEDPDFRQAVDIVMESGDDIARGIQKVRGLKSGEDFYQIQSFFSKALDDPENFRQLELLFGEDQARQIKSSIQEGLSKRLNQIVTDLDKNNYDLAKEGLDKLGNLRYMLLLNLRPRFHGGNLLTGADIAFSTTGKVPEPADLVEATKVFNKGNPKTLVADYKPNEILFRDPAGRPYTTGELYEMLTRASGKTTLNYDIPAGIQGDVARILADKNTKTSRLLQIFKDLPQSEDLIFRYSILKRALREGRSPDEAVRLARVSMFDIADPGFLPKDVEDNIRKFALFWTFARNNLQTAVRNLTSPLKGWGRISRAERLRKDVSTLLTDEEVTEFSPSYAMTRIALEKFGLDPKTGKSIVSYSPSLSSIGGVYDFAEILKGKPQGFLGGSLAPEYKRALGISDEFSREFSQVPQEWITILDFVNEARGADTLETLNYLLELYGAEPITPVYGRPEKGAVGGLIYPLTTPKQKKAMKNIQDIMSFTGVSTIVNDYVRPFTSPKLAGRDGKARALNALGVTTPYAYYSPEAQAYFDTVSRMRELQAVTGERKSAVKRSELQEREDKIKAGTATEAEKKAAERQKRTEDKSRRKKRMDKPSWEKEKARLNRVVRSEINKAKKTRDKEPAEKAKLDALRHKKLGVELGYENNFTQKDRQDLEMLERKFQ